MKKSYAILIFVAMTITGCSSGPSTSDAKDAVVRSIGGECDRISIESFEKVNGVAQGDSAYQVAVTFDLKVSPSPSGLTPEQWGAKYEDLNQQATKARNDANSDYNTKDAFEHDHNGLSDPQLDQKIKDEFALSNKLAAERDQLGNEPVNEVLKACPKLTRAAFADINRARAGNQQSYLTGFTLHVSKTLNMIKTDNGWMESVEQE